MLKDHVNEETVRKLIEIASTLDIAFCTVLNRSILPEEAEKFLPTREEYEEIMEFLAPLEEMLLEEKERE